MKWNVGSILVSIMFLGCKSIPLVYNVPGTINKRSAQGMDIFGDHAFMAYDGGLCRIYNLKRQEEITRFYFESKGKTNHSNSLAFGVNYPRDNNEYPALYISECTTPGRCFVESVCKGGSRLIQTISFQNRVTSWFIDRENRKLYAMFHTFRGKRMTDSIRICQFSIPPLSIANIELTDNDVEYSFKVKVPYTLQGGTIEKGVLYIPVGKNDKKDGKLHPRKVLVIDIDKAEIINTIDISLIKDEPEDVSFYKKKLYVFCGQAGGMYSIKIN